MIRRAYLVLIAFLAVVVLGASPALAQDDGEMTFDTDDTKKPPKGGGEEGGEEGEMTFEEGDATPPADDKPADDLDDLGDLDDLDDGLGDGKGKKGPVKGDKAEQLTDKRVAWQDIVVVVRKPFLKTGRLELLPTTGVTMNDNIIQHFSLGGQVNYYLTDVLSTGVEGQYYVSNLREPFDLVARQARRLPTVNEYKWSAALNFHYVPIYGKFAIPFFDETIIHWESYLSAGVGVTKTAVLPRDPALQSFSNLLITPNVGLSMRFFINRFLTVNLGVRDYLFVDKFEAVNRMEVDGDMAKENADSAFVNNIMVQAGISVWFPMSFEYTTFR